MKSITPDRCQKELAEVGGTDFGFAFGEAARFRVSVFKQRGNIAMVLRQIPNKLLTMEQLGLPPVVQEADHAAARVVPGHRADRLGQEHDAGQHDQLHQRNGRPPHHHDRRPDRVLPLRTRSRRSTSAKSASTCRAFPKPCGARCGKTRT